MTRYTLKGLLAATGLAAAFTGAALADTKVAVIMSDSGSPIRSGPRSPRARWTRARSSASTWPPSPRPEARRTSPADRHGRGPDRKGVVGQSRSRRRHRGPRARARAGAQARRPRRVHRQARRHAGDLYRDEQRSGGPDWRQHICDSVESGSDVAVLQGIVTSTTGQHRAQGGREGLVECGLNLVAEQPADWTPGRRKRPPRTSSRPTPACGRSSPRTTTWRLAPSKRFGPRRCWTRS